MAFRPPPIKGVGRKRFFSGAGFEPATTCFSGKGSFQLSYPVVTVRRELHGTLRGNSPSGRLPAWWIVIYFMMKWFQSLML